MARTAHWTRGSAPHAPFPAEPRDEAADAEAFAALYTRHRDALFQFCLARTRDVALAEDLVQDAFETAFAGRRRFDPTRSFWSWLASIAARDCIDAYRRRSYAEGRIADVACSLTPQPSDVTSAQAIQRMEREWLEDRLRHLPRRQRVALQLFALDGWSYAEIAEQLGDSVASVKALIVRARAKLREVAAGGLAGVVLRARAMRTRAREAVARMHAALATLPSSAESLGALTMGLTSGAGVVLAAVAAAFGLLVPVGQAAEPGAEAASSPVRLRLPHRAAAVPEVPAVAEAEAEPAARHAVSAPEPVLRPHSAAVERTAHEAAASLLPNPWPQESPSTVRAGTMAASPDYEHDRTVYVVGNRMLVTGDGGATWRTTRSLGLAPTVRLLFPPAYPLDGRIFAVTAIGLQVTRDGGDTFETVLLLPEIADAAFSPDFNAGDPSMLLVAGRRLWEYRDDTGVAMPVDTGAAVAGHLAASIAYAGDGTVLFGTRFPSAFGDPGLHLSRCTRQRIDVGAVTRLECDATRLPQAPTGSVPVHVAGPRTLFVPLGIRLAVSSDGGRSFRDGGVFDFDRTGWRFFVGDLVAVPSATGESAVVAMSSIDTRKPPETAYWDRRPQVARTDDGGRTWQTLFIDLPYFYEASKVVVTPSGRMVVASPLRGIACSEDGGRTWGHTCATPEG